jgi:hypothetical protein
MQQEIAKQVRLLTVRGSSVDFIDMKTGASQKVIAANQSLLSQPVKILELSGWAGK